VSALAVATRTYTPLSFRPQVERVVVSGLLLLLLAVWVVVLPLEFLLA
jgi:hypothetical protein